MAKQLRLEVVTPERLVLAKSVDYVGAPGLLGEFGILPGHVPFLSALGIGSLLYKLGGKNYYVFLSGGFAEISGDKVMVLAEVAELPEEIDLDRAKRSRERAERRLEAERRERIDYVRAKAALQRSIMRMKCREESRLAGTGAM
ncbi:F0F1 ATP synthase subunit epsilon [Desulfolutivibrio sulfoxidireducens]|uniref:F0F1 ATP synthase subunit epsilon n=1 Tax=Desulfolutivibrio sulfoxidireducens TaxID=2773299 RepID=UPI00159E229A|nr:F0F1 ATP synthase subunit epsilon [Desulfolutivibrio sulfoxidireducens]QLA15183.1 F0F1 ATP synthase subunit epsilon [Desulfolutivibrio sulfoxidireducens]QLA18754.1 F0F1 ATP synthase subunit epsilon [Desulfolutivibrio sulfoxidireducens]